MAHDFDAKFPKLRTWMTDFFSHHEYLVASLRGRNILTREVLRLVRYLVMYGFVGSKEELQQIIPPIIGIVNGYTDVPFPPDVGHSERRCNSMKALFLSITRSLSPEVQPHQIWCCNLVTFLTCR